MSRFRYSAARKVELVRRVVEDGCSVCEVARQTGISEGSLFFWVRRYRQFLRGARAGGGGEALAGSPRASETHAAELGTLVAYLRRASVG